VLPNSTLQEWFANIQIYRKRKFTFPN